MLKDVSPITIVKEFETTTFKRCFFPLLNRFVILALLNIVTLSHSFTRHKDLKAQNKEIMAQLAAKEIDLSTEKELFLKTQLIAIDSVVDLKLQKELINFNNSLIRNDERNSQEISNRLSKFESSLSKESKKLKDSIVQIILNDSLVKKTFFTYDDRVFVDSSIYEIDIWCKKVDSALQKIHINVPTPIIHRTIAWYGAEEMDRHLQKANALFDDSEVESKIPELNGSGFTPIPDTTLPMVYTFYQIWEEEDITVDFTDITRIGFFSLIPDTTGNIIDTSFVKLGLEVQKFRDVTKKHNCKVDLVVSLNSYTDYNKRIRLDNDFAVDHLIHDMKEFIRIYDFDGATIDYQKGNDIKRVKLLIYNLMKDLAKLKRTTFKDYHINVIVQKASDIDDLKEVDEWINQYIVVNPISVSKSITNISQKALPLFTITGNSVKIALEDKFKEKENEDLAKQLSECFQIIEESIWRTKTVKGIAFWNAASINKAKGVGEFFPEFEQAIITAGSKRYICYNGVYGFVSKYIGPHRKVFKMFLFILIFIHLCHVAIQRHFYSFNRFLLNHNTLSIVVRLISFTLIIVLFYFLYMVDENLIYSPAQRSSTFLMHSKRLFWGLLLGYYFGYPIYKNILKYTRYSKLP